MKRLVIIFAIMFICAVPGVSRAQDDGDNSYFYASLSPYGSWIELNSGVTVWRPLHMRHGWSPYRYGHWIWTDDGWYWDSDEPYGSIVYHYGRWYYDDYYGWLWVPDNVWAPAWVEWRYNDDYIGWAPLSPYASFSAGFGISFTTNYVTPYSYWHFVGYRHMCDPNVYNYYIPDHDRFRVYSDTRYRTNYGYSNGRVVNRGVDVDYVRQRGGGRIVESRIQRVEDPRNTGVGRNENVVRAFIPTREQISRADARNVEIKRATRTSSLDMSHVNIGRTASRPENNTEPGRTIRESDNRMPSREAPRDAPPNLRENNRPQNNIQREQPVIRPQNNQREQPVIRPQNNQPNRTNRSQVRPYSRPQQRVQTAPQVRRESAPRQSIQPNVQRRENAPQQNRQNGNNNKSENNRRERK